MDKKEFKKEEKPEVLLMKFLEENNLDIKLVKQPVRYLEDGGLVIEPPKVVVIYAEPKPAATGN